MKEKCFINGVEKRFTDKRKEHAKNLYAAYQNCRFTSLDQVYGRCSDTKRKAMAWIKSAAKYGTVKILSHTAQFFTVVYLQDDSDGNTWIIYDTGRTVTEYPLPVDC